MIVSTPSLDSEKLTFPSSPLVPVSAVVPMVKAAPAENRGSMLGLGARRAKKKATGAELVAFGMARMTAA